MAAGTGALASDGPQGRGLLQGKGLPALPAGMLALPMAEWALYGTAYFLLLLPVLLLWTAAVGPSLWQMHKM